ncbi:MAG: response regulator [Leptolyngbya sp. SIOISBB]|nr:response regulator [Leptolyngbya sp. SIOISBB]
MIDSATTPYRADILAIDDTPENLQLLSQMLTQRRYKVRSVTKGRTALRAAQAAPPDLILLDINMPEMDGYAVCEHLKSEDITRHIPVIFISALGETLDKVRAFDVGGVDFVTKPFQVEEVISRIETHLQLRRLQQQLQAQNVRLQQEIRDRKQAQETFSKAFRSSPSPIAITTLEGGQFIEVNPSFLKISGYARHEVIGFRLGELNLGLDMEQYRRGRMQLAEAGALHNWEFELRTKTGDLRTVLVSVESIELQGHQCALAIANDITERKRLENEFISLVSHELKTPMNSMIGALDLLGTGQLGSLTDKGQKMVNMAINNAERLVRLVNDVLDLERMKSGTLTLHPQVCNVPTLFQQAETVMQSMAQAAQVNLVIEPIDVKLQVDGDRIQQLLTNLLSNAIKFSAPGSTVHLSAQVAENDANGHQPNLSPPSPSPPLSSIPSSTLHLTVRDQGRGIPADKLTLIFDRFQQVDASDARAKGGTGLGLSICRQIVQQHQGHIWAESAPGEGSTFHVTLPLTELDGDRSAEGCQG